MINWIQKTFHTDKWWRKTVFIFLTYVLYWCIFYGSWFVMPSEWFNQNSDLSGIIFLIYLCILVPITSFFIPYLFKKTFEVNKVFLYILHIVVIIFSAALFFT